MDHCLLDTREKILLVNFIRKFIVIKRGYILVRGLGGDDLGGLGEDDLGGLGEDDLGGLGRAVVMSPDEIKWSALS